MIFKMLLCTLGCFVHTRNLRIIKIHANFGKLGTNQICENLLRLEKQNSHRDSLKLYCQQISEFEFLTHFVGRKKKEEEGKKKERRETKKGGRKRGRASRKGDRKTGRKERGWGKEKKKCLPVQSGFHCVTPLNRPMTSIALNLLVFSVFSYLILQQNLTPWSFPPPNTFFTKTQPFFGFLIASLTTSSLPLYLVPILLPDCLMVKCPCLLFWVYPHSLPPHPDLGVVCCQDLLPTWQQLSNSTFCPGLSPDLIS